MSNNDSSPSSNPLEEAKPESLNILFARDPEKLADQDISRIIEALRDNRKRWRAEEMAKSEPKKRAAKITKPTDLGQPPASLEDIFAKMLGTKGAESGK